MIAKLIQSLNACNIICKQLLNTSQINCKVFIHLRRLSVDTSKLDEYNNLRDFVDINADTFASIATDDETKRKIELILCEYEYEKYTSLRVSSTLTIDNMKDLLRAVDSEERKRMMTLFYRREMHQIERNIWKAQNSVESLKERQLKRSLQDLLPKNGLFDENGDLIYGLWRNTLFTRITKSHINAYLSDRLRVSAMFGQKIVIDLGFDKFMNLRGTQILAHEINEMYLYNKNKLEEPFDLHFTNCDMNSQTMQSIPRYIKNWKTPYSVFHTQSHLDLFDKNKLVYLSNYAKNTIKTFNDDHIYILSGIKGKHSHKSVAYNKAKKEGILTYRLPVRENIIFGDGGPKTLNLSIIIAILNSVKLSNDWMSAIKDNVPQNYQKSSDVIASEDLKRIERHKRYNKYMSTFAEKYNLDKLERETT